MQHPAMDPRDDLLQNPESGECSTQRLTRGTTPKIPIWEKWSTQRLTLGLVNNGDSPKLTTCLATDLGTGEKWPRGKNLHPATDPRTTRKMPLRQNEGIPAMDLRTVRKWGFPKSGHLPSVSLHSPLYRLSTLSIQAREGEGVIYR